MFCKKVSVSKYIQEENFKLLCIRCFTCSPIVLNNSDIQRGAKQKGKITVVKQILRNSKEDTSSVLGWKKASTVVKRLNWENKYLFGSIQSSKPAPASYVQKKIEPNKIIQHETQIPVIEPLEERIIAAFNPKLKNCDSQNTVDLRIISSFPLVNNHEFPNSKLKINNFNYLRKNLEALCKNSAPSVSTILEKTMPEERVKILNLWKQKMINKLGEKGFEKYQKELFANGASLHNTISAYFTSTPEADLQIKEENIGHWKSLKGVFPHIKDVKLLEEFVTHPFLCYKGIVDCFAKYKNHLVVIDWKTSKKYKLNIQNTYDNPLQIAAYVGALNFDPKYQYLINKGLIVVAYENGLPATTHFMDGTTMMNYWKEWLLRVKRFWEMKKSEDENS